MGSPITKDWTDPETQPSYGFLFANTCSNPPEQTETCLASSGTITLTGVGGIVPAIIESIRSAIVEVLTIRPITVPSVTVRPVRYQPHLAGSTQTLDELFHIRFRNAQVISELRRKVNAFSSLLKNWDGEGAEPISYLSIATALCVIEQIDGALSRKNVFGAPSVRAFPDGSIFFKWIEKDKELTLTVLGTKVEAQRWQPLDSIHSLGLWEISLDEVSEHIEWVLT